MNKTKIFTLAACSALVLALTGLAGCSGNSAPSNSSSSNAANTTASSNATSASSNTASNTSNKAAAIVNIDGVDVSKIAFVMVGDTPNFQPVFSNTTDKDVEVDLSKFVIKGADGNEVSFHLTKKTISANTPYAQNSFTASPGTMKVGDKISVSYDGQDLGTYEVEEF